MKSSSRATAALASMAVFLCSLPAFLFGALWTCSQLIPASIARSLPRVMLIDSFFGFCWFVVILAGRPLLAIAFVADVVLVFVRGAPLWLKALASAFVICALLGTLLIESQARAVRH